ncbi:MAG: hypothetical protein QOG48_1661, partial [Verrucomicrobiota bacterium]
MNRNAFIVSLVISAAAFVSFNQALYAGPETISSGKESKQVQMEQAPVCDPRWYFSLGGGADFDLGSTDFTRAFEYRMVSGLLGGPATLSQHAPSLDWSDVYDTTWHAGGEIGYALTEHLELFGAFNYAHADSTGFHDWGILRASAVRVGTLGFPLRASFDDYDAITGELGFRFFFLSRQARIRPYLAISGGATHVDNIDLNAVIDVRSIGGPDDATFARGSFYEDSWVGTAAAVLGVEANLTCH